MRSFIIGTGTTRPSYTYSPGTAFGCLDPKSRYYKGSQLQSFNAEEDPDNWGVLKTPRSNMKRGGHRNNGGRYAKWWIVGLPIVSEQIYHKLTAASTIIDSRLGWTCEEGAFHECRFGEGRGSKESGVNLPLPDTDALSWEGC